MSEDERRRPPWAERIRQERARRGWTQRQAIAAMRSVSDVELPADDSMLRMWKRWERGDVVPQRYRHLIARTFEVEPAALFGTAEASPPLMMPASPDDMAGVAVADSAYVDDLERTAGELIGLDTKFGGDDVLALAVRAFRSAYRQLASGLYVPALEHRLPATVGQLAQVASWVAYDADQQSLSRQLAHEALLASRLAGDRDMELFELASLAMQSIHLHRPGEAMRIATDVLDSDRLSARTEALFHVRQARALAQTGDRRRALDTLHRASAQLSAGASNRDPAWTWWIDDSELAWQEAMCLSDDGDRHAAVDLFQRAYDLRSPSARRARFNDLAHLLDGQTAAGAWHDAEVTMLSLLAEMSDVRSGRTSALLRRIAAAILRERDHGPSTTLVDAAEQLRRTL